jgi:hypothetical protein
MGGLRRGLQRQEWLIAPMLALVVTAAVWGSVPSGAFQLDDFHNVVRDPATTDTRALLARLPVGVRPLLRLSYFADAWRGGLTPRAFLTTNLVLHLTTGLAVYVLARRRLGTALAGSLSALTFALQPAHVEAVAYVSGRSTGLMTSLLLWGLVCHDLAIGAGQTRRRCGFGVAASTLFAAAALAKEVALVAPLFVWLWEWTRPGDQPSKGRPAARRAILPAAVATAIALLLACSPRYRYLAQFSLGLRDPWTSFLTNVGIWPMLVSLWGRPGALSVVHPFEIPSPVEVGFGVALVAGLGLVAVAARRRVPLVALAGGWVLIALAPTHSILARLEIVTEKPLYLAWVAPAFLFGGAAAWLCRAAASRSRMLVMAVGVALSVVVLFSAVTVRSRVALWADPARLWADAVSKAPGSSRAWTNLGAAYLDRHDDRAAMQAFRRALTLDPGNVRARANLGIVALLCGSGCEEEG